MKIIVQLVLAVASLGMAYLIWNSIDSKIILTESVEIRDAVTQERLTHISEAQIEYKKVKTTLAKTFRLKRIMNQVRGISFSLKKAVLLMIRQKIMK